MECRLTAIPKLYTESTLLIFNVKERDRSIWSIYSEFFVRAIKKSTLTQFADNTGPDQSAHPRRLIWVFVVHTESMDTVAYVIEQRISISDCTNTHAHLDHKYLHMA